MKNYLIDIVLTLRCEIQSNETEISVISHAENNLLNSLQQIENIELIKINDSKVYFSKEMFLNVNR